MIKQTTAPLLGAGLIAGSIMITSRYQLAYGQQVLRLDRLTGSVTLCVFRNIPAPPAKNPNDPFEHTPTPSVVGQPFDCDAR